MGTRYQIPHQTLCQDYLASLKEIGINGLYIRARSLSNGEMIDIKCKTSSGCFGFSITTCSSTEDLTFLLIDEFLLH